MQRTLKHVFELGFEYGLKWAIAEKGAVVVLFLTKIGLAEIDWIESRCDDIMANFFSDFPTVEGPWRRQFVYGFAAGVEQILPELDRRVKEAEKELDEVKRRMEQMSQKKS